MKKIFVCILLATFIIFNLNFSIFSPVVEGDTTPARLLPFSLLSGKSLYFDEYAQNLSDSGLRLYFLQKYQTHYVSSYPLLSGLIATPVYLPAYMYLRLIHSDNVHSFIDWSLPLEKISASLIAALSAALLFILLVKLFNNRAVGIAFSLIFAFALQTFSISSQHLWQHGAANLFLIISLLYVSDKKPLPGLLAALLSFWARPLFIVYCLILWIYLTVKSHSKRIRGILTGILFTGIAALVAFNYVYTGSIIGGYNNLLGDFVLSGFPGNIAGLFFSPSHGVLFYMPLLFVALSSVRKWKNLEGIFRLQYYFLLAVILIYSLFDYWWGGYSWGARLLTDITVPTLLLCAFLYSRLKHNVPKGIFWILVAYSMFIQIVGVFYYPQGDWEQYPKDLKTHKERLWNFGDNPIFRSLAAGPDLRGVYWTWYLVNNMEKAYKLPLACNLSVQHEEHVLGYALLTVRFTNSSKQDLVTYGERPVTFYQIYPRNGKVAAYVTAPQSMLPPVIKSNETVSVRMLLIPPGAGDYEIIILAGQSGNLGCLKQTHID